MEDIAVLDCAIPLVRGEAWEWFAVFWDDPERVTAFDLTAKTVTAEIRWRGVEQAVTVVVTDADAGQATLSLAAEDTDAMPLGRLPALYIAVDGATWARAPVEIKEGI